MSLKTAAPNALLAPPTVDEAPNGVLDPQDIPPNGVTVRIKPYDNMQFRDHVYLFVGSYTDDIPISSNAVGRDVVFSVAAEVLTASTDDPIPVHYEVQLYLGERVSSEVLNLTIGNSFESEVSFDLSAENYVVVAEKPPSLVPSFARMSREATWGVSPYAYASSDSIIAIVDEATGAVIANSNGSCAITATDNNGESRRYTLTVKGVKRVSFLSASADWEGMKRVCTAASLSPVSVQDLKRLWLLYYPSSGAVASYLGWLNYPFWAADALGAGAAWTYDLNGPQINENASASSTDTFLQVVGISQD